MRLPDPLATLARLVVDTVLRRVRTSVVGRVESYDPAAQSAQVLPLVGEQDDYDGEPRELGPVALQGVPVVHYGSGKRGITFGLDSGDPVVLVVRHRSHQEVDAGANPPITPQRSGRMALDEAVALPGYVPPGTGQATAHQRSDGAMVIYLDVGEPVYIGDSTAAKALALAEKVDARLSAIATAFDAHIHAVSGANTLIPTTDPVNGIPIGVLAPTDCDDVVVRS